MTLRYLSQLGLLAVCCSIAQGSTAPEGGEPCKSPDRLDSDVTLNLTLKDGQSVYHEGEIISLQLAFTSSGKNRFLDARNYDRSGRLNDEYYCLRPNGHDPLQDYFGSGIYPGFVAGGIGGYQTLSGVPYVIIEELNEWRSLPPGRYSLRVVSSRVSVPHVVSNEVNFQVIPATPEWQALELGHALTLLDADHKKLTEHQFEQTKHAVRVLRFLGSEAATRELARRFWFYDQQKAPPHMDTPGVPYPTYEFYEYRLGQDSWDFKAGLIGTPHREIAIQELTAAIRDPSHAATRNMLETLALLEIMSRPEYQIPSYDSSWSNERKTNWERQRNTRALAYNDLVAKLLKQAQ